MKIEDNFKKLEEILGKLESDGTGLEDSFKLYEEGMEILKKTELSIDKVEKDLKVLREGSK